MAFNYQEPQHKDTDSFLAPKSIIVQQIPTPGILGLERKQRKELVREWFDSKFSQEEGRLEQQKILRRFFGSTSDSENLIYDLSNGTSTLTPILVHLYLAHLRHKEIDKRKLRDFLTLLLEVSLEQGSPKIQKQVWQFLNNSRFKVEGIKYQVERRLIGKDRQKQSNELLNDLDSAELKLILRNLNEQELGEPGSSFWERTEWLERILKQYGFLSDESSLVAVEASDFPEEGKLNQEEYARRDQQFKENYLKTRAASSLRERIPLSVSWDRALLLKEEIRIYAAAGLTADADSLISMLIDDFDNLELIDGVGDDRLIYLDLWNKVSDALVLVGPTPNSEQHLNRLVNLVIRYQSIITRRWAPHYKLSLIDALSKAFAAIGPIERSPELLKQFRRFINLYPRDKYAYRVRAYSSIIRAHQAAGGQEWTATLFRKLNDDKDNIRGLDDDTIEAIVRAKVAINQTEGVEDNIKSYLTTLLISDRLDLRLQYGNIPQELVRYFITAEKTENIVAQYEIFLNILERYPTIQTADLATELLIGVGRTPKSERYPDDRDRIDRVLSLIDKVPSSRVEDEFALMSFKIRIYSAFGQTELAKKNLTVLKETLMKRLPVELGNPSFWLAYLCFNEAVEAVAAVTNPQISFNDIFEQYLAITDPPNRSGEILVELSKLFILFEKNKDRWELSDWYDKFYLKQLVQAAKALSNPLGRSYTLANLVPAYLAAGYTDKEVDDLLSLLISEVEPSGTPNPIYVKSYSHLAEAFSAVARHRKEIAGSLTLEKALTSLQQNAKKTYLHSDAILNLYRTYLEQAFLIGDTFSEDLNRKTPLVEPDVRTFLGFLDGVIMLPNSYSADAASRLGYDLKALSKLDAKPKTVQDYFANRVKVLSALKPSHQKAFIEDYLSQIYQFDFSGSLTNKIQAELYISFLDLLLTSWGEEAFSETAVSHLSRLIEKENRKPGGLSQEALEPISYLTVRLEVNFYHPGLVEELISNISNSSILNTDSVLMSNIATKLRNDRNQKYQSESLQAEREDNVRLAQLLRRRLNSLRQATHLRNYTLTEIAPNYPHDLSL